MDGKLSPFPAPGRGFSCTGGFIRRQASNAGPVAPRVTPEQWPGPCARPPAQAHRPPGRGRHGRSARRINRTIFPPPPGN